MFYKLQMESNYDWMLFLTSPVVFTGVQTTNLVFTTSLFQWEDHGCSLA